jgi:hypothetical protein
MGNVIPYYRRSVGVIVFREDGKMLVGQRSAKKPDGIGTVGVFFFPLPLVL